MGGKGSKGPSQEMINQEAYRAGSEGQRWNDIQGLIPTGHDQALDSRMAGKKSYTPFEFPEIKFPSAPKGPDMPSYEEQMADSQAMYQQQMADAERMQGVQQRDDLYSQYMTAADTASEYISGEIADEESNARLLGIDYAIDDEIKGQRISDYFATVWGEGEQQRLEGLINKWGKPTGFAGFTVTRGDGSKYATKKGEEKSVGISKGMKPTLATEEDEDLLGTTQNVLGV